MPNPWSEERNTDNVTAESLNIGTSLRSELAVSCLELQVKDGSSWLAVRNFHCYQPLPSNDYSRQNNKHKTLCVL
jgi:hypothetical protein